MIGESERETESALKDCMLLCRSLPRASPLVLSRHSRAPAAKRCVFHLARDTTRASRRAVPSDRFKVTTTTRAVDHGVAPGRVLPSIATISTMSSDDACMTDVVVPEEQKSGEESKVENVGQTSQEQQQQEEGKAAVVSGVTEAADSALLGASESGGG